MRSVRRSPFSTKKWEQMVTEFTKVSISFYSVECWVEYIVKENSNALSNADIEIQWTQYKTTWNVDTTHKMPKCGAISRKDETVVDLRGTLKCKASWTPYPECYSLSFWLSLALRPRPLQLSWYLRHVKSSASVSHDTQVHDCLNSIGALTPIRHFSRILCRANALWNWAVGFIAKKNLTPCAHEVWSCAWKNRCFPSWLSIGPERVGGSGRAEWWH